MAIEAHPNVVTNPESISSARAGLNSGRGRCHATAHFSEPNAVVIAFAPTGDGERVAVFQPFSLFAAGKLERIRAAPGQLAACNRAILRLAR